MASNRTKDKVSELLDAKPKEIAETEALDIRLDRPSPYLWGDQGCSSISFHVVNGRYQLIHKPEPASNFDDFFPPEI